MGSEGGVRVARVGTNLRSRERTSVPQEARPRGCPERLTTVEEVSVFGLGVVLRSGLWNVREGMSKVVRE